MGWFEKYILSSNRVFIIAEAGINHNGKFDLAVELIKQAKAAGADCVKFQAFRTSASESRHSSMPGYFTGRIGTMSKQEWSRALEFSVEEFRRLKDLCFEEGILFLSTACDVGGLRVLEEIGAEALKIASADCINDYLLAAVGRTGLPVLLSTGMSDIENVEHALEVLEGQGAGPIALLQCTSQYPAPFNQINLRAMATLRERFGVPVGLSDHSEGIHVPVAAAALGAAMVEKHFTLSRDLPGVDHAASIEPHELKTMVQNIRQVEAALGDGMKTVQPVEAENALDMRRSLMAARDLVAGTVLTFEDITAKRPGTGLLPTAIWKLLGKRLMRDLATEDFFTLDMVEDDDSL